MMPGIFPFVVKSTLPRFQTISPGEELWFALRDLYMTKNGDSYPSIDLFELTSWVEPSGALAHYHADVTVANAVFKLLKAAKRIEKDAGLEGNALYTHEGQELFSRGVALYMVEQMGFGALDMGARRLVPPLVLRSHEATRKDIKPQARAAALDEAEEDSQDGNIRCYCCDAVLWSPLLGLPRADIALDHIWPRSLGGVSFASNLLPVCEACNGAKEDRATWSVFGVVQDHAVAERGLDSDVLLGIALHRRAAMCLATESYLSLKDAYRVLGPRTELAPVDPMGGRQFFNLSAHDSSKLTTLW